MDDQLQDKLFEIDWFLAQLWNVEPMRATPKMNIRSAQSRGEF